jgi:hypothetical protein
MGKMKLRGALYLFFAAGCSGSNLLINPGFETGAFTGWTTGGTSTSFGVATSGTVIPGTDAPFTPALVNVNSGTFAAFANVDCSTNVGACTPRLIFTLTQVLAVVPNSTYSVGFYLSDDSPSGMGIDVDNNDTQIFVNGTGVLSPSSNINIVDLDTSFHLFSGSFSTGASNSATITFQIDGSGTSRAGVSLDDFFVTASAVPEPTSYAPISFGLAMLALLKIRRAAQCDKQ